MLGLYIFNPQQLRVQLTDKTFFFAFFSKIFAYVFKIFTLLSKFLFVYKFEFYIVI